MIEKEDKRSFPVLVAIDIAKRSNEVLIQERNGRRILDFHT